MNRRCSPRNAAAPARSRQPDAEIAKAARAYSNWGRWGDADVLGTVNVLTAETRRAAAGLVRRGASFSLAQRFDMDGPQKGWRRRTNPAPINPIAVK